MKHDNHELYILNVSVTKGIYRRFLPDSGGNTLKCYIQYYLEYMHVQYLHWHVHQALF